MRPMARSMSGKAARQLVGLILGVRRRRILDRMKHADFRRNIALDIFMLNRPFHNFIILTMIVPLEHDHLFQPSRPSSVRR
jgi:hypothetical protein